MRAVPVNAVDSVFGDDSNWLELHAAADLNIADMLAHRNQKQLSNSNKL